MRSVDTTRVEEYLVLAMNQTQLPTLEEWRAELASRASVVESNSANQSQDNRGGDGDGKDIWS